MAVFNTFCLNQNNWKTDLETGCRVCDDYTTYEQCRQSFYLQKQTEITQQNSQEFKDTKTYNVNLEKIVEQQNQQITSLIENSEILNQKIEKLNLTNIITASLLGILILVFIIKKLSKK